MVTLHDLLSTKLEDSETGQGWIACTTDALFLEKPSYYDLLIDLTSVGVSSSSTTAFTTKSSSPPSAGPSSTSSTAGRPRPLMYVSVPKQRIGVPLPAKKGKGKQHKPDYKRLQTRWAWSDARLWGDLDKSAQERGWAHSGTGTGGYDSALDSADDIDIDLSNTNTDDNNNPNNLNPSSNSGSPPVAIRGLTLKRSFSTPNPGARGGAGRRGGRYNSITMPSVRSSSGFSRKKGATTAGKHPRSVSSGGAAACDHENPEHDFTLVPPPTLDTREGLDILLHTSDNSGKGTGNLNLADALSKTEGVLDVLDSYAAWAVGVLRGKVGEVVREGKGKSVEEEEGVDGEASSESEADVEGARANAGQEPEEGNIRTSAIELTPSGGIGFTRRSTPPPPATSSSILPFGKKKSKSKKSKKMTFTMYPRDLLSLDLNPLSGSDVKYLEGVVGEYASRVVVSSSGTGAKAPAASEQQESSSSGEATQEVRVKLVVKRGWRDLVGVVFGL
ncbi:hypothetical protein H1R20_g994, partial [Candolleomyces eurysporus]